MYNKHAGHIHVYVGNMYAGHMDVEDIYVDFRFCKHLLQRVFHKENVFIKLFTIQ
jgi:hypothetical protein